MCSTFLWNEQSNGCVQNLHHVIHLVCLNSRRDFSFNNSSLFPLFILNWGLCVDFSKAEQIIQNIPTKNVEAIPP